MNHLCRLESRALLSLGGTEVVSFLHNLVTCDVEHLKSGEIAFGALLTPQGKILFDFFLVRTEEGFVLDCDETVRDDLKKRLMFYRLRADVTIEDNDYQVFAAWGGNETEGQGIFDPRHSALGQRLYVSEKDASDINAAESDWHANRIAVGIPQSGMDFELGSVFPHEVLMDQTGGVAFTKGCFVGQEVVSRMQHRGTARSRFVHVEAKSASALPAMGTDILADGKIIGSMGSSLGNAGLAIIRLDRLRKAQEAGFRVLSDDTELTVSLPGFVSFTLEG